MANVRWLLMTLLVVLVIPSNIYLFIWRVREVLRQEHNHYLYKDEITAMKWLENDTCPSDIVFSGLTLGMHIPGVAGNKVYLGHWAQTVDYYDKQANVSAFFQKSTPDSQRLAILKEFGVAYVMYGRDERSLGDLDPAQVPGLTLVFDAGETQIYRTQFASSSQVCK
jgi:uncharacterized membrane protein